MAVQGHSGLTSPPISWRTRTIIAAVLKEGSGKHMPLVSGLVIEHGYAYTVRYFGCDSDLVAFLEWGSLGEPRCDHGHWPARLVCCTKEEKLCTCGARE